MHDDKIEFRLWNDSDEERILALVRRNYGDIDTSHAEYFDWEYRRNPAGRATICVGVLADGTVVTALATVPTPVLFDGARLTASQLVNGMTRPEYRGRGLFPKCTKLTCEAMKRAGIALSYGFPNPNSFPGLTRKAGYADIGRAVLLMRPHAPAALLSTRLRPAGWLGLGGIDRMLARAVLKKPAEKLRVRESESFDGLALERLQERAKLAVAPDAKWLNWRYMNVPRRRYRLIYAGEKSDPLGAAVYRASIWEGLRIGTVNDLFLPPDCDPDAVESLMCRVFTECEADGCAVTFALVSPASRKLQLLKRAGFLVVPERFEPQPFSAILMGHTVSTAGVTISDMEVSFGAYDVF